MAHLVQRDEWQYKVNAAYRNDINRMELEASKQRIAELEAELEGSITQSSGCVFADLGRKCLKQSCAACGFIGESREDLIRQLAESLKREQKLETILAVFLDMHKPPSKASAVPACDCHKRDKQVCDICQGPSGPDKDSTKENR